MMQQLQHRPAVGHLAVPARRPVSLQLLHTAACLPDAALQRRRQWQPCGAGGGSAPRPRPRLVCRAAAEQEMTIEGDYCLPAFVTYDNKANPNFTVLEVEVADYPGGWWRRWQGGRAQRSAAWWGSADTSGR